MPPPDPMLLTYRHLLRPTSGQHKRLVDILEQQRTLYNAALEERISAWRKSGISITRFDQQKSLTAMRADRVHGLDMVALNISRWTLKRLDEAFHAFFYRIKRGQTPGFPRFKGRDGWNSFGILEWSGCRLVNGRIALRGVDRPIRVNWHRRLPKDADIKGATFTQCGRRWFVSLQVKTNGCMAGRHALRGSAIGVDIGIENLATWDNGTAHGFIDNVRARRGRERQRLRMQRALARCMRGSKRRRKVREQLRRIQEQVANHRLTHLHRASAALTRRFETIFVEKLKISNMTRSAVGTAVEPGTNVRQKAGLNEAMLDVGLGRFVQLLRYKAERAGGAVLDVDPRNTSQTCSGCGTKVPKPLSQRMHRCGACGLEIHRDVNAARNIRDRGLAAIAAGGGVLAPGEQNVAGRGVRAPGTLLAA